VSVLFTPIRKLEAGDPVDSFDCGQPDMNRSRRSAKHFERQGETALAPQPPNQNCMDAVLI
jgi:hypothetical protein